MIHAMTRRALILAAILAAGCGGAAATGPAPEPEPTAVGLPAPPPPPTAAAPPMATSDCGCTRPPSPR
jgi:hypothetical protein